MANQAESGQPPYPTNTRASMIVHDAVNRLNKLHTNEGAASPPTFRAVKRHLESQYMALSSVIKPGKYLIKDKGSLNTIPVSIFDTNVESDEQESHDDSEEVIADHVVEKAVADKDVEMGDAEEDIDKDVLMQQSSECIVIINDKCIQIWDYLGKEYTSLIVSTAINLA